MSTKAGTIAYEILLRGKALPGTVPVKSMEIEHRINRIPHARLVLEDGDLALADFPRSSQDQTAPGVPIEIRLGHEDAVKTVFKGVVVKQSVRMEESGDSALMLYAKGSAYVLNLHRQNDLYLNQTDDEVMGQLAREAGLDCTVEPCTVTHPELIQYQATAWDFMVTRAEANGMVVRCTADELHVAKPDTNTEPELALKYGEDLLYFEAETDGRAQPASLSATAWNASNQTLTTTAAREPDHKLPGNQEPGAMAQNLKVPENSLHFGAGLSDQELGVLADAHLQRQRLAMVIGQATIKGRHGKQGPLHPGQMIMLKGVGARYSGPQYLSGVRHRVVSGQWHTHLHLGLSAERFAESHALTGPAAGGLLPPTQGLQIGTVSALAGDPRGESRIQVTLPLVKENQSAVWARWASPEAGKERGLCVRPELGDEVVVGFFQDDPRQAVILGALYSSQHAAPLEGEDANAKKVWQTRSGLQWQWDDEKVQWTIATPKGNQLVLDESEEAVTLEDQHGNRLQIDAEGITISTAKDLKISAKGTLSLQGGDISIAADMSLKATGSASAELSASGETTVKGAMVMIN